MYLQLDDRKLSLEKINEEEEEEHERELSNFLVLDYLFKLPLNFWFLSRSQTLFSVEEEMTSRYISS